MDNKISIFCSRSTGIWRAGKYHPAGRNDWPAGSLTAEQLDLIRKEPLLEVIEEPRPQDADAAQKAALAVLEPFLSVPAAEAEAVLAGMLSGKQELPPVSDPALDPPLENPEAETKPAGGKKK